jgi:hypothetical protein
MRLTLGNTVAVREIPDALLLKALLASTAMPLIFDRAELPMADGSPGLYVDGSVANDAAVSIAHTIAQNLHVVFVEATAAQTTYRNASSIALGIYKPMVTCASLTYANYSDDERHLAFLADVCSERRKRDGGGMVCGPEEPATFGSVSHQCHRRSSCPGCGCPDGTSRPRPGVRPLLPNQSRSLATRCVAP